MNQREKERKRAVRNIERKEREQKEALRERKKERKRNKYILTDFSEWFVSIQLHVDEFNQCKGGIIADRYQQVEQDSAWFRFCHLGRKWLNPTKSLAISGTQSHIDH